MTDLPQSQIDSRLRGNGLVLVRILWFIVALAALGIFIFSLPGYLRPLGETRPIQASPEFIAMFEVISVLVSLATALLSLALAGVLFWRKPDDKMALCLSFFLLGYGIVMAGPLERLHLAFPGLALNAELAQPVVMTVPFVALFALFPNGRFVPGWMRWVALGSLGFMALYFLAPCCDYSKVSPWLSGLITLSGLTVLALVIYAQIYRYRRVSSPIERQQTKWVVYGLGLFLVWVIVVSVPYVISQSLPADVPLPWWTLLASAGWWLSLMIMPLSLALSILRYRLFEIDIIIKRTVQYTLLSGAGFVVYLLAVGGTSLFLQTNIELVAGLIALALLVIFFNPARQRLQALVDKVMPYTPPPAEVLAELEAQKRAPASTTSLANWLMVARVVWLVVLAAAIVNMLLDVPYAYNAIATLSDDGRPVGWSREIMRASLAGLSLSPTAIAVWQIVIAGMMSVAFWAVAVLIMWRRPRDRMALFVGFFFAAMGGVPLVYVSTNPILQPNPNTYLLRGGLGWLAWTSMLAYLFVFPNGRFVPRKLWPVMAGWAGMAVFWNFFADTPLHPLNWPNWLYTSAMIVAWGSAFAAQVYRYRFVSTRLERQQLKWVLYLAGVSVVGILIPVFVIDAFVRALSTPGPQVLGFILLSNSLLYLVLISVPVALAFILLRHRLWDIDIVVKRTVQYALISGAGFIIYLLAVGGTSLFLQSNIELVAGVIAVALVVIFFNPAHKRLQVVMDKVMPYTPPPPEVLAEMEREKAEREKLALSRAEGKRMEKEAQRPTVADSTHLQGGWLTVARVAWIITAILSLGLLLYSTPAGYTSLSKICATDLCEWGQLTSAGAQMLAGLGLSVNAFAILFVSIVGVMNLSYMLVGWLIFWRKSDDRAALFISWALVLAGVIDSGVPFLQMAYPVLFVPMALLRAGGYLCFYLLLLIFPNGQFVPRWSRWLILPMFVGQAIAFLVLPSAPWVNTVSQIIWLVLGLGFQFYRYLRVSGPPERQQTKWVLVGLVTTLLPYLLWIFLAFLFPSVFSSIVNGVVVTTVGDMAWWVVLVFGAILFPLSIAFSMFRYRLWEVDLVIRRTVQYAVISALGFGVYLLAVGGTSLFLQSRNDLLAGGLALGAVVAAFVWLRPRLEAVMDKYAPLPQKPPEAAPLAVASTSEAGLQSASTMPQSASTMPHPLSTFWQRLVRIGGAALTLNSLWVIGWTLFYTWEFASAPPPRIAEGLAALGVSTMLYFAANAIPITLLFLSYFAVAVLMFLRLPNDRMALFTAVFFMGFSTAYAYPAAPEFTQWFTLDRPHYFFPFLINAFLGYPLLIAFFALYPDGVFVPRWMRWGAVYGFVISAAWSLFPQVFATATGLFAVFVYGSALLIFGLSLYAQIYRYFKHATPLQRQQTRWMVYGVAASVVYIVISIIFFADTQSNPATPPADSVRAELITMPLGVTFALLPLAVGVAIFRYRLFEMEIIVRRTVIYGAVVGGAALAYFGGVALLQWLSQALTGPQSNFVVVLITLGIVALFNPMRRRFQVFIDRAFYREKVDFRQAFTAFAREVRTIIDLPELLRTLVNRTTELFHITYGAVLLRTADGHFEVAEARNLPDTPANYRALHLLRVGLRSPDMTSEAEAFNRLRGGAPLADTRDKELSQIFPLIVPLVAAQPAGRTVQETLIGALALGPRRSDQNYSREDQTMLSVLADQAGTALYVAQLIQEKQAETQRIEEAERRLESYANSPAGRAERLANSLREASNPPSALSELHALTQRAGSDPATAAMLEPLSAALTTLNAPTLAGLADGYRYIFASQSTPEVLPVGLRTLTDHLAQLDAPEALELYRLCQNALEANSISAIAERGLEIRELKLDNSPILHSLIGLQRGLLELSSAAEALRAYERVDSQPDKLAYLASAVERLTHADRAAQAELGAADRPIVQRITANWLTVVTGAMSELQTRARLVCRLLTRHTWTGEVIAVALAIRNEGRGAALNLKVALAPAPDYTLVDESVLIERLAAGEEAQAELRVRPHIGDSTGTTGGQFRARFVIVYADPRGPDQTENFADVVYLLALEGEFKFIPNPYVVGTPLQTGSALFCGREDVFEFIQENLLAAHQNNLVLIGQRRTGKTSLLKQLPARLGEKYASVYLDGQSLALDPGLPNFFYSLATEIAFALEDRGLEIGELPDFNDSPATTFERKFLTRVREVLGDRHLLLLLDEFEELEGAVRRGNLDVSVFGFLRHMIQHSQNLSVIFCGTHRMEELAADYWSVLFNISLYRHVAFLQQAEAFKLIQEPVGSFGMKYDDLALDKMWRVTAGHPYFLQLLCHSLVNQHNKSKRNYVTVADVNAALDEILASGEAHFIFLWTESTREERLALTALSRMMPLTGQANPVQVTDYLAERGVPLDRRSVSEAMHHLALRDILNRTAKDGAEGEAYRWQLGLLGLWVEKYKSLSRVVDEVRD